MNLKQIKKIANKRTKLTWKFERIKPPPHELGPTNYDAECEGTTKIQGYSIDDIHHCQSVLRANDAEFFVMASNHFDKLLAVIEAAQELLSEFSTSSGDEVITVDKANFYALEDVLIALEDCA